MASAQRRVVTIDCQYLRPKFAASYLVIDPGVSRGGEGETAAEAGADVEYDVRKARAVFIDNNTAHSVPLLLDALKAEGLTPEQVDFVIITHVHLDHAGGTSQLMKTCPDAVCLSHPRATKHLVDPSKLIAGARQVYGDEAFDRMYGVIEPLAAERVRAVEDGETVPFGQGAPLKFIHTRGHANHHLCVYDPDTQSVFTGDSFGLRYPALQREGLFIFPTTSPTDFDYHEAVASLDKIVETGAQTVYPTHFGALTEIEQARRELRGHLSYSFALMKKAKDVSDELLTPTFEAALKTYLEKAATSQGLRLTPDDRALMKLDIELNAQGLTVAVLRERAADSKNSGKT